MATADAPPPTSPQDGGLGRARRWAQVSLVVAAVLVGTNLWTFSWTSVVGFLPLTTAVTYLGSPAQSLSPTDRSCGPRSRCCWG